MTNFYSLLYEIIFGTLYVQLVFFLVLLLAMSWPKLRFAIIEYISQALSLRLSYLQLIQPSSLDEIQTQRELK